MKAGEKHDMRHEHATAARAAESAVILAVICPSCGSAVELWTGGEETRCLACDYAIFKKQRLDH
jgi:DNA-directed RNA polymerase subunit RPC12/RpoP